MAVWVYYPTVATTLLRLTYQFLLVSCDYHILQLTYLLGLTKPSISFISRGPRFDMHLKPLRMSGYWCYSPANNWTQSKIEPMMAYISTCLSTVTSVMHLLCEGTKPNIKNFLSEWRSATDATRGRQWQVNGKKVFLSEYWCNLIHIQQNIRGRRTMLRS